MTMQSVIERHASTRLPPAWLKRLPDWTDRPELVAQALAVELSKTRQWPVAVPAQCRHFVQALRTLPDGALLAPAEYEAIKQYAAAACARDGVTIVLDGAIVDLAEAWETTLDGRGPDVITPKERDQRTAPLPNDPPVVMGNASHNVEARVHPDRVNDFLWQDSRLWQLLLPRSVDQEAERIEQMCIKESLVTATWDHLVLWTKGLRQDLKDDRDYEVRDPRELVEDWTGTVVGSWHAGVERRWGPDEAEIRVERLTAAKKDAHGQEWATILDAIPGV